MGRQKRFISKILEKVSVGRAARACGLSERTIRDWRREKLSVDFVALQKLCRLANVFFPSNVKIKERYWYVNKGAFAGWKSVVKKYGKIPVDSAYRKRKWYEWWEKEGKYKQGFFNSPKPIKEPIFSEELAEFTGIVLGDGGISKYQITITLHDKEDKQYSIFVAALIKKLFNVPVGICHRKNNSTIGLIISRVGLVRFFQKKIGLKAGDKIKQQIDIPPWIKRNKRYSVACLRGLVDTDGCIFNHRYKVNGKLYQYKKIAFTSHSKPLRRSVFNILKDNGFWPRLAPRNDVRLDRVGDVERYFKVVIPHNPKYLKKYRK